jgi:hypothetical protein
MSNIDEIKKQIEELQKQLAEEESKNIEDNYLMFKDSEVNFVVYNYSNNDEIYLNSFSKLCDYIFTLLGKRDFIFIDYQINEDKDANYEYYSDSEYNRKELFNHLFKLNAMQLTFMDFGIADKNEKIKYCIYIQSPGFYDDYVNMINSSPACYKDNLDKEYRMSMHEKAKSWYIWENNKSK